MLPRCPSLSSLQALFLWFLFGWEIVATELRDIKRYWLCLFDIKCRLCAYTSDLLKHSQDSKEHLALGNDLEDASECQRSLLDHTPPLQRIRDLQDLQERPHHNWGWAQSLKVWTNQWQVNSPSCCWTAMKSKKPTCLEFPNAISLGGKIERVTLCHTEFFKQATKSWDSKLSMFLVANCWIERLRKGETAATCWASLAPTSSSVHLFATNNWVHQTSTPNTPMHQISTNNWIQYESIWCNCSSPVHSAWTYHFIG